MSEQRTLLDPRTTEPEPGSRAEGHPYRAALWVMLAGYALLTSVLLVIGLVLTHVLDGSIGRWDQDVNEYLARRRTGTWNDITSLATEAFNTVPVVVAATIVVGFLVLRHRVAEAAFLVIALTLEITVFLSVTFIVARDRPDVVRLNSTPATSSFPSGHTAAATVLLVGIALIITCCTRNSLIRVGSALLAAAIAVTVGFGRVYRGLHHPSDVMAGCLFGLACLVVAVLAVRAALKVREAQKKRLIGATALSTSR